MLHSALLQDLKTKSHATIPNMKHFFIWKLRVERLLNEK
jgi:hypothetical protein